MVVTMHRPHPIAVTMLITAVFGYAFVQLVTEPLNPGSPSFPLILAFFGASLGVLWRLVTTHSLAGAQDRAFACSMVGGWIGILIYAGCLISTLS